MCVCVCVCVCVRVCVSVCVCMLKRLPTRACEQEESRRLDYPVQYDEAKQSDMLSTSGKARKTNTEFNVMAMCNTRLV